MLDVLCVGDAVIDIFLRIDDNDQRFGLDKESNKLFFNYGDKISVDKYLLTVGGNATNTAVGISRLGLNTGLCAEIGNDEFSEKITSKLKKENINTDFIIRDTDKQTSITVALSYLHDRTLFTEHIERKHNFNLENLQTKLIYLTSLGNEWQNTYEQIIKVAKDNNILLAFNPGSLQLEHKNRYVYSVLEQTDYLFINKQEAEEILYGKELELTPEKDKQLIKKLLFGLQALGAKNVIITDSDNGSYLQIKDGQSFHLGIVKVDSTEKTGAGDAYTAGFLASIINNPDCKKAMVWGAINSSSVIKKIGAQEGLLTKIEIEDLENGLTNFYPEAL